MLSSKYLPSLVCGFAAAALMIIPEIKNGGYFFIVPLAAVFSLILNKKINNSSDTVSTEDAFIFGIFTGLFTALFMTSFDLIITFFVKTNEFIESLPYIESMIRNLNLGPFMEEFFTQTKEMAKEIRQTGFSFFYLFMILFSNLVTCIIFGMLGGLIGMQYLNKYSSPK